MIEILETITMDRDHDARFCLFIDGLDECEGEHYELVQVLARIGRSQSVKMCISSRPWNVFRTAFDQSADCQLVLQDLTRDDLDRYIQDKLEANDLFRALLATDQSAHLFPQEIRKRAQGVFLWVFLVVRSLLRGLTEDDDMPMLRERFRDIPGDLEAYFRRMLTAVEKVYSRYMARSLLLACTAETPLPLSSYWYIDVDSRNTSFAMQAAHEPYTHGNFLLMKKNVTNCISKWCRDLLEVTTDDKTHDSVDDPIFQFQVDFLHRTVREFLITGTMQGYLKERAGCHFRPEATLSRIFLVHAKTIPSQFRDHPGTTGHFQYAAGNMMYYVRQHEIRYGETLAELGHELDRIGNTVYPPNYITTWAGQNICDNRSAKTQSTRSWSPIWDESQQLVPEHLRSSRLHRKRDLIAYAVELDLQIFVKQTLEQRPHQQVGRGGTPLLYHALGGVLPSELGLPYNSTPHAMVLLLIDMLADMNAPMQTWPGANLWQVFLKSISAFKHQSPKLQDPDREHYGIIQGRSTFWQGFWQGIPAFKLATIGLRRTETRMDDSADDSEDILNPIPAREQHDAAIRWHFSALNEICKSLRRRPIVWPMRTQFTLPPEDAALLEAMIHHGADPSEMHRRVLAALLEQCCAECRIKYASQSR
jgi:hypothetical protein